MSSFIRPYVLISALLAVLLPSLALAGPISIQVKPGAEVAEIGKDLILEITVTPSAGESVLTDKVQIEVTTPGSEAFFGNPYPLRALDDSAPGAPVRFEWAAPVGADRQPQAAQLKVDVSATTSSGGAEQASWSSGITVDFGEEWSADKIANYLDSKGLFLFLLVVFGFGLLMSLSPCIYPMIPITLAVIGAQSQEKGTVQGLIMSFTYVVGMALVYAIMGALSATVFSGITAFMQSPAVLVPIALLLFGLSFSMFGAFELEAPAFLRDRLQGPGAGGGTNLVGVFAMGLVAGLVASPCVGPFLAALLVWVATTGDWILGFFTLFTFGMGMGMLLIGVGTFPALVGSMPQSGGWMDTIKKAMGLLLVAMAFYFVRPGSVLPAQIFYPMVGITTILVAVFMGAFDSLTAESGWWPRASKGLGLAAFVAGIYLLFGSFLQHGFLMPSPLAELSVGGQQVPAQVAAGPVPSSTATSTAASTATAAVVQPLPAKVPWTKIHTGENVQAFLAEQQALAKANSQPIMIDFWAKWCVYCKKLDKMVWNVPAVVAESQRFVTIKVDATAPDDAEMEKIKEAFKVPGLPRVIFIDSRGEVLHGRSVGFLKADEMLALMQSIR
ncbi:MAG: cytochrome c biogenesis protein CcdA [Candidatus Krumholzibacteria bacterium]|nr:cytochrome c biogenesis protein CcdA [Candidatus Krumholzibacteria bacterium]